MFKGIEFKEEEEEFITERFPTRVGYYTSRHTRALSINI